MYVHCDTVSPTYQRDSGVRLRRALLAVALSPSNYRLRRREAGNRDAVRGARDVIQSDRVTKCDGRRLAAVLAADADFEVRLRLPPEPCAHRDELADTVLIEHLEGIGGKDA